MATFGTFVAGQVLTAAELNSAGVWQDYTPSWTQSATISKTVNWARYVQLGKWVQGSVKMTATSAGTATNEIRVGLPVAASSNNSILGNAQTIAASDSQFSTFWVFYSSSTVCNFSPTDAGIGGSAVRFWGVSTTADAVNTVASGDIIYMQFCYEAA
jgi:hypothetical protein